MLALLAGLLGICPQPVTADGPGQLPAKGSRAVLVVELFTRAGSEQGDRAAQFLKTFTADRPDVEVTTHDVLADAAALRRLHDLAKQHKLPKASLPTLLVGNQIVVGYKDDATTGRRLADLLTCEVFTRDGCPHCQAARRFLTSMAPRFPGLKITVSEVIRDAAARDRMQGVVERRKVQVASLPLFSIYGKIIVGYGDDQTTGRDVEKAVQAMTVLRPPPAKPVSPPAPEASNKSAARPRSPPIGVAPLVGLLGPLLVGQVETDAEDAPPPPAAEVPDAELADAAWDDAVLEDADPDALEAASAADEPSAPAEVTLRWFGTLRIAEYSLPAFTLMIGLIDGFNPCAMWVLIFLLSILVNLQDRRKIVAIAGTFVLISGLAYLAFMAAWLNVFLFLGMLRHLQVALGTLAVIIGVVNIKDFFFFKKGLSFSIPESAKPGIYARVRQIVAAKYLSVALLGAGALAIVVNVIELLCTAGLPALYTQVLSARHLPAWENYAYLALYIAAYMFDDAVVLTIAVATLSHRRLQESEGRWLKLISGLVVLGMGAVLLLRPDWLLSA